MQPFCLFFVAVYCHCASIAGHCHNEAVKLLSRLILVLKFCFGGANGAACAEEKQEESWQTHCI